MKKNNFLILILFLQINIIANTLSFDGQFISTLNWADEFESSGATELAAEVGAKSADHLMASNNRGLKKTNPGNRFRGALGSPFSGLFHSAMELLHTP